MTTPPKTREEWYDKLLHLSPEYSEDTPKAWAETLDSIMSLQAEVTKTRDDNQELHRLLCSANNLADRLQTEQDLAKDALQAEVEMLQEDNAKLTTQVGLFEIERKSIQSDAERSRMIVANIHSMAVQTNVRVDSQLAKSILSEIEKAR